MTDRRPVPMRFVPGDMVQVLELHKAGHVRTPHYVRHKLGRIHQFCGYFLNPEALSVGDVSGPLVPLYRVAFPIGDLWPGSSRPEPDMLFIEIYDHWLAPAPATTSSGVHHV